MDESTIDALVADEATASALGTVLARAEATDGTVTWADVSDDVDAATWGRLLATDVLVDAGGVFVVDDPVALRNALTAAGYEVETDQPVSDTATGNWRARDKVAGVAALVMAAGYQVQAIEEPIVGAVDAVLGPAAATVPFPLLVLGLAVGTATVSTGVRRWLVDSDGRKRLQKRMKRVRTQLRAAKERGDQQAIDRLEDERVDLMRDQFGLLVRTLRPMAWTMLVTIPVFLWVSWLVASPSTALVYATPFVPAIDRITWTARVVGPLQLWMLWYVACQLGSTLLVKRSFDRLRARTGLAV